MRFSPITRPTPAVALAVAACAVLTATVVARAQRGGGGGGAAPVPLTASSLDPASGPLRRPGRPPLGTVQKAVTKTTFTMAQGKTPMKQDVLVIAPNLQSAPDENAYVTVVGDAIKFDPWGRGRAPAPGLHARFAGRPRREVQGPAGRARDRRHQRGEHRHREEADRTADARRSGGRQRHEAGEPSVHRAAREP